MAGRRWWVLWQFTWISTWRRWTASTHTTNSAVLPATQGSWLMSALTGRYKRFPSNNNNYNRISDRSWFDIIFCKCLNHFFSPSTSVLAPHPSVTEIVTFCNNPVCFLNFLASTSSRHTELFKGLGHHVKIKNWQKLLLILLRTYLLYMLWRFVKWMI